MPTSSSSSRRRASDQALARLDAAAREQPVLLPGFSCRQRSSRSCQRSAAETRMRGSAAISLPTSRGRAGRARSRERVHLDELDLRELEERRAARSASPAHCEALARVGVQEDDEDLAAVAGVDQAGRVHERDPVARGEPGTRLDEARMSFGDCDGEAGADRRPLSRRERHVARRRRDRARRLPHRPGPAAPHPGGAAEPGASRARGCRRLRLRDEVRREAPQLAAREPGARRARPRRGRNARRSALRARTARSAFRRPRTGSAAAPARSGRRSAAAIRSRSSSSPSPVAAETCSAPGKRFASRRRVSGSTASILFRTSSRGKLVGADLRQHRVDCGRRLVDVVVGRGGVDNVQDEVGRRASPRAWRRSPRPAGAAGGG